MDIHGPWVERVYTDHDGNEGAKCIATLDLFERDYQAFEVMASSAESEWAITSHRGIPSEPCWQWQRHLAEDLKRGIEDARRMAEEYDWLPQAPEPFDWQTCWREGQWRKSQYGSCFGHSWLTTDEVEEAQRRYLAYYEDWRTRDPETFAGREFGPYPGFTVALAVMRKAESICGQPCRLVFCFDC